MSVYIASAAWRVRGLTPAQKLVLLKLADMANDEGVCWPSNQRIADDCDLSRRAVQRIVARFEEVGLLRRHARTDPTTGRNLSNWLVLTIPPEGVTIPPRPITMGGRFGALHHDGDRADHGDPRVIMDGDPRVINDGDPRVIMDGDPPVAHNHHIETSYNHQGATSARPVDNSADRVSERQRRAALAASYGLPFVGPDGRWHQPAPTRSAPTDAPAASDAACAEKGGHDR